MFFCCKNYNCCNYKYADKLDDLPIEDRECDYLIEAEPVIHAHWKWHICSNCKGELPYTFTGGTVDEPFIKKEYIEETDYCPHCGAKMDEE